MRQLVTTEWLEKNIKRVKILDATWCLPNSGRDALQEFKENHIKNSIFFDIEKNSKQNDTFPKMNHTNKEWKTPPLWGLGYAKEVNSRATFLHDGRAKTILEAVMWHSGEAKDSLDLLLAKYKDDLDKLEKFLKSL